MGGIGSGNFEPRDAKPVVEDCLILDVTMLSRQGWLKSGVTGAFEWISETTGQPILSVWSDVERDAKRNLVLWLRCVEPFRQAFYVPIRLEKTKPNWGGTRSWMTCPVEKNGGCCGRRVAKLYYANGSFGCRQCHNLTYRSCQDAHRWERALRFSDK